MQRQRTQELERDTGIKRKENQTKKMKHVRESW